MAAWLTAHSFAYLRIAESVTVSGARLATGRAGSPLAGRVSHPLDDKQGFMKSSHTPILLDQPCLVALNIESTGDIRLVYKEAPAGVDIDLGTGRVNDDGYGDVDIIRGDVSEILGSDYSDTIRGSDNDELFIGRGGDDVIEGGGGFDVLNFDRSGVGNLIVDMADGEATGTWHGRLFEYSFSNIEHVRGGAGFDILIDSEGDDTLEGGGSLDFFLMVDGGNDTIVDFSNEDDDFIFLDSDLVEDFGLTHADVIAAARQDGGDVLIDLSTYGMGTIRLKNFNIDWLTPEDIRL